MGIRLSTARPIVACCALSFVLAACSTSDVPERSAGASSSSGTTSSGQSATTGALAEVAASARERAGEMPTLLLIVNETDHRVLLTSADGKNAATVEPGRSLHLASERVCGWLPLTASTTDGRVLEAYTRPCAGQTWTITDRGS